MSHPPFGKIGVPFSIIVRTEDFPLVGEGEGEPSGIYRLRLEYNDKIKGPAEVRTNARTLGGPDRISGPEEHDFDVKEIECTAIGIGTIDLTLEDAALNTSFYKTLMIECDV